jgi:alpha-tubulin suppressor-like RCC1 family protein
MRIRLTLALLAVFPLAACTDYETPTAPLVEGLVPSYAEINYATPETIIAGLIAQVEDLVMAGTLSKGEGNALASKLDNALKSLEKGHTGASINQLNAFINQAEALVLSGRFTDEGQPLIDAAHVAIARLGSTAIAVDAGESFTCALLEGGQVLCWGDNNAGQLGNGSYDVSPLPVPVSGDHVFVSITLGRKHACGLTGEGTAYCWGSNGQGALGAGLNFGTRSPVPVEVSGSIQFQQLSAGNYSTCGLTLDGSAFCWGNHWGNGLENSTAVPNPIGNTVPLASVSSSSKKACGLAGDGTAYCWGLDRSDFGNGTPGGLFLSPVVAASGETFESLYAGSRYTCGLKSGGTALCWGKDDGAGKLGLGTLLPLGEGDVPIPTAVVGGHAFANLDLHNTNWVYGHTCGVTTAGHAYCWGTNVAGELGSPSTDICLLWPGEPFPCSATPILVGGGIEFTFVASGNGFLSNSGEGDPHSCGLGTDGGVYCWGGNLKGQLGDGTYEGRMTPIRVNFYGEPD